MQIEDFKPLEKNTLRGFARVRAPSGLIIHDVSIHIKNESVWAAPPSKPMIGKDGLQMRSKDGKPLYSPILSFADRATQSRWSDAVVAALRASHPEALL